MKKISIFILLFTFYLLTFSDQGCWLPDQLAMLKLEAEGLKVPLTDFYREDGSGLMNAVVSLGGGTGEFISVSGLILTNHHVAFNAIQRASSSQNDYIENGFYARTIEEEIPATGYFADVLLSYRDISAEILPILEKISDPRKKSAREEELIKKIQSREEKKGNDLICQIRSFYSGNRYLLFIYKRLRDIRLVYAPPQTIGNFGGETDNWCWPRHTGDFSILRAYVSPDGFGREFRKENIPYRPKRYFKLSLKPLFEDQFHFIIGFPGRTFRNISSREFFFQQEEMRQAVDETLELIKFIEEKIRGNREWEIRYASRIKGLNNGLKNRQAKLEGFARYAICEKIVNREMERWQQIKDPLLKVEANRLLDELDKFFSAFKKKQETNDFYSVLTSGPALFNIGYTILRRAQEAEKPDLKRDFGYRRRDYDLLKMRLSIAERSFVKEVDLELAKYLIKRELKKSSAIPTVLKKYFADDDQLSALLNNFYTRSALLDPEKRIHYFQLNLQQLRGTNDPLLNFLFDLESEFKKIREQNKAEQARLDDLKRRYEKILLTLTANTIAADANGTMRLTFGRIKGYSPRDAVFYRPFSYLRGVMEKECDQFEFRVPEKLKTLYFQKDFADYGQSDIVVNFLGTTNITGGNSGSPILDASGNQIGIIFDMTYESVVGDYYIIDEIQRGIGVTVNYMIFILDKFSNAQRIIDELEIIR